MIKRWFVYSAAGTIVSCTTIPSTAAITDTSIILINSTVTTSTTNFLPPSTSAHIFSNLGYDVTFKYSEK